MEIKRGMKNKINLLIIGIVLMIGVMLVNLWAADSAHNGDPETNANWEDTLKKPAKTIYAYDALTLRYSKSFLWNQLSSENRQKLLDELKSDQNNYTRRLKELWDDFEETNKETQAKNRQSLLDALSEQDSTNLQTIELIKGIEEKKGIQFDVSDSYKKGLPLGTKFSYKIDEKENEEITITEPGENGKTHRIPLTGLPTRENPVAKIVFGKSDTTAKVGDTEQNLYGNGVFYFDKNGNYVFINDGKSVVQQGIYENTQWAVKGNAMFDRKGVAVKEMIIKFGDTKNGVVSIGTPNGWNSGVWMYGDSEVQIANIIFKPDNEDPTSIPNVEGQNEERHAGYVDIKAPNVFGIRGIMETKNEEDKKELRVRIVGTNQAVVALGTTKDAPIPNDLGKLYEDHPILRIYEKEVNGKKVKVVFGNDFQTGAAEVKSESGKPIEFNNNGITTTQGPVKITKEGINIGQLTEADYTSQEGTQRVTQNGATTDRTSADGNGDCCGEHVSSDVRPVVNSGTQTTTGNPQTTTQTTGGDSLKIMQKILSSNLPDNAKRNFNNGQFSFDMRTYLGLSDYDHNTQTITLVNGKKWKYKTTNPNCQTCWNWYQE